MYSVISHDGWLSAATKCLSPNYNRRPEGQNVSLLVIHNISLPPGEFGTGCVQAFFCNQLDASLHPYFETISRLQVSAHVLIERTGHVTQFVSFDDRAWHAGVSSFQSKENCNDFSVGIELEGSDHIAYTDAQYDALAAISRQLMARYPLITRERIVGHCDIAPGRKTDPGEAFNWHRYFSLLGESPKS